MPGRFLATSSTMPAVFSVSLRVEPTGSTTSMDMKG
jgi:hypothetical protein